MTVGEPPGRTWTGRVPPAAEDSTTLPTDPAGGTSACRTDCYDAAVIPEEVSAIDLDAVIGPNLSTIVAVLAVVVIILVVVVIVLARRVSSLGSRLAGITRGSDGRSLEAVLEAHLERVHGVASDVADLSDRTDALETASRKAFSRVGLVRYNPFEETGGNQSFALALLDRDGDGWVLSSLHARAGTRVYAKAIAKGRSDAALSDEEAAAIRQATA